MIPLKLTYACEDYDLQHAIIDGSVQPEGIAISAEIVISEDRHDRMARGLAYDLAEFSMSVFMASCTPGAPWVGLPIFPRRMFIHRYIFVNADAGIERPEQLAGRRVGIRRHQNTLSLVARGILHDEYGLDLHSIRWVVERPETLDIPAGAAFEFEVVPPGRMLQDMLVAGDIDAMMIPETIAGWDRGDPRIRRLFPNFKSTEQAFYRRTGIFPIMHVVVVRRDLLERESWIAEALLSAFRESQVTAFARLGEPAVVSLAWARALLEEERAFFGGSAWPIGVKENVRTIQAMARWSHLLGLTPRELSVDEMFPASLMQSPVLLRSPDP